MNQPNQAKQDFRDRCLDQLNRVAPVTARAMFGGYGLYSEGVMFALIAYETLYFKVDDGNRDDYTAVGMGPFTYMRREKTAQMSYYQLPEQVFSDLPALADWVEKAQAAARRGKRKRKAKK